MRRVRHRIGRILTLVGFLVALSLATARPAFADDLDVPQLESPDDGGGVLTT